MSLSGEVEIDQSDSTVAVPAMGTRLDAKLKTRQSTTRLSTNRRRPLLICSSAQCVCRVCLHGIPAEPTHLMNGAVCSTPGARPSPFTVLDSEATNGMLARFRRTHERTTFDPGSGSHPAVRWRSSAMMVVNRLLVSLRGWVFSSGRVQGYRSGLPKSCETPAGLVCRAFARDARSL